MSKLSIEQKLEKLLAKANAPQKITVDDIKSLIYHAQDHNELIKLLQLLSSEQPTLEQLNENMQILQEAWNTLPHKALGGVSPQQKSIELYSDSKPSKKSTTKQKPPTKRTRLQNLFQSRYPQQVQFVSIGETEWGFEFPKKYYDLMDEFVEFDNLSDKKYEKECQRLLAELPELFDVANSLTELYLTKGEFKKAQVVFETVITTARSYIPTEFIPEVHQIIWAYVDNRPFLRLLESYAVFVEEYQGVAKAIPFYEELINFNPNDNQGIRQLLSTAYLKVNKLDKMLQLAHQFKDDFTPEVAMGKILALIKTKEFNKAEKELKKVGKYQKHVIKELLKSKHSEPANLMPDHVMVGGEDEAYYYWQSQGTLWQSTPGAIEFLREKANQ